MITEERLKYFQKEVNLIAFTEVQFLMDKAGVLSGIASTGVGTITYKINSGSYATPVFPIDYSANDIITFNFSYLDQTTVRGNIILYGKDN